MSDKHNVRYWRRKIKLWFILHHSRPDESHGYFDDCKKCKWYSGGKSLLSFIPPCSMPSKALRLVIKRHMIRSGPDWERFVFYGVWFRDRTHRYCIEWIKNV